MPEYQSEQVYSTLLSKLIVFKQLLKSKKALWREHVLFLSALNSCLPKFHLPEVHDLIVPSLFDDIQTGNTQLRQESAHCIVLILAN